MNPSYLYTGNVTRVIDGDTIDVRVDLGFSIFTNTRFRLFGIDTPEKTSKIAEVKEIAITATNFVKNAIEGKEITIESMNKDKYGRWLAKIHYGEGPTINEQLVALGLAKAYFGDSKTNLKWES
jgi:micrococcal nuclease